MKKRTLGRILLFIVAIIWGTGFVATAFAIDHYTPLQTLALRFSISFIILLLINFSKLKHYSIKSYKSGIILGVYLFLAFAFQTFGLKYTTASNNAFLTAVNIVIVPFLVWIVQKQKPSRNNIIGAVLAFLGIAALSFSDSIFSFNIGDGLTLICAVFFALQIFTTDELVSEEPVWLIMVAQMGTAAMLSWIMVFIMNEVPTHHTASSLLSIFYLGVVSTLIAYGLQTFAQKYTSSTEAAIILSTEAFFGMIASVILLGELMTINMVIGAILIFSGVIVVELT